MDLSGRGGGDGGVFLTFWVDVVCVRIIQDIIL